MPHIHKYMHTKRAYKQRYAPLYVQAVDDLARFEQQQSAYEAYLKALNKRSKGGGGEGKKKEGGGGGKAPGKAQKNPSFAIPKQQKKKAEKTA